MFYFFMVGKRFVCAEQFGNVAWCVDTEQDAEIACAAMSKAMDQDVVICPEEAPDARHVDHSTGITARICPITEEEQEEVVELERIAWCS